MLHASSHMPKSFQVPTHAKKILISADTLSKTQQNAQKKKVAEIFRDCQ